MPLNCVGTKEAMNMGLVSSWVVIKKV